MLDYYLKVSWKLLNRCIPNGTYSGVGGRLLN